MSAGDYYECPICHGLDEPLRNGYKSFYGKVSEEEYAKLKKRYEHRDTQSVASYQEISLNEDGTISLGLSAECSNCHAKWKFDGVVKA